MKKPSLNVLMQLLDEVEHNELNHLLKKQYIPQKIKKSNKLAYTKTSLTQDKI